MTAWHISVVLLKNKMQIISGERCFVELLQAHWSDSFVLVPGCHGCRSSIVVILTPCMCPLSNKMHLWHNATETADRSSCLLDIPSQVKGVENWTGTDSSWLLFLGRRTVVVCYLFQHDQNPHLVLANVGAEAWSSGENRELSFNTGMDTGTLVLYYCPPGLKPQSGLEEGKDINLDKIVYRPGEAFIITLYWFEPAWFTSVLLHSDILWENFFVAWKLGTFESSDILFTTGWRSGKTWTEVHNTEYCSVGLTHWWMTDCKSCQDDLNCRSSSLPTARRWWAHALQALRWSRHHSVLKNSTWACKCRFPVLRWVRFPAFNVWTKNRACASQHVCILQVFVWIGLCCVPYRKKL